MLPAELAFPFPDSDFLAGAAFLAAAFFVVAKTSSTKSE
jgi:hypothetical protein